MNTTRFLPTVARGPAALPGRCGAHPAQLPGAGAAAAALAGPLQGGAEARRARPGLAAALDAHRERRATDRALRTLDTATLRDLGLTAAEIGSVASEVAALAAPTRRRVRALSMPTAPGAGERGRA